MAQTKAITRLTVMLNFCEENSPGPEFVLHECLLSSSYHSNNGPGVGELSGTRVHPEGSLCGKTASAHDPVRHSRSRSRSPAGIREKKRVCPANLKNLQIRHRGQYTFLTLDREEGCPLSWSIYNGLPKRSYTGRPVTWYPLGRYCRRAFSGASPAQP